MYAPPLATYVTPPAPAEKKSRATENAARILASSGLNALTAALAMLALGAFHADWNPAIPALGFWPLFAAVYAVRYVLRPYDVPRR